MICPGYARPPGPARRETCRDCNRPLLRKNDLSTCDACKEITHAAVERMYAERA